MRAAYAFDGLVEHRPLDALTDWMLDLQDLRCAVPGPAFDAAVVVAFRAHLFEDFEDPGRDPDLGEPT